MFRRILWSSLPLFVLLLTIGIGSPVLSAPKQSFKAGDRVEYVDDFGEKKTGVVKQVTPIGKVWVRPDDGGIDAVDVDDLRHEASAAEDPFASDEEKANRSVMRTWEDSSGRFQVEAKLLRVEDDAVVLERKDGKKVTVPLSKLSDADRRFLSGGTSETNEAEQVEITPTDLARARPVDLASTSKWRYTPDPGPSINASSAATSSVDPDSVPAPKWNNKHVRFTLGEPSIIFEEMEHLLVDSQQKRAFAITLNRDPSMNDAYESRVFACDLVEGKVDAVGVFVPGQLPVDISPDDQYVIAHSSAFGFGGCSIAGLYSLAGKEAKPVVRWQPYNTGSDHDDDIRWMRFVDDSHVLLVSETGQPSLWKVPELEAVWAADYDRFAGRSSTDPAISPGGKVVALPSPVGIVFVELLTGRKLGCIDVGDVTSAGSQFAFDAAGRRLALVERSRCRVWNLKSQELVRDFAISQRIQPGQLAWVDDDRLLVSGRYLIDVNLRIWLWDYDYDSSVVQVRGGTIWAIVSKSRHDKWILGSIAVPHADALELATPLNADELLVVKPGASMAIELNLNVSDQQRREIEEGIAQNVRASGFRVDPNSKLKIVGTLNVGPTQEITYENRYDPLREREKTQHTVQTHTVQLTVMYDDQPLWRYTHTKQAPHLLSTQDGESRQQALDREMQQDPTVLARVQIPRHIALGVADQPYGHGSGG